MVEGGEGAGGVGMRFEDRFEGGYWVRYRIGHQLLTDYVSCAEILVCIIRTMEDQARHTLYGHLEPTEEERNKYWDSLSRLSIDSEVFTLQPPWIDWRNLPLPETFTNVRVENEATVITMVFGGKLKQRDHCRRDPSLVGACAGPECCSCECPACECPVCGSRMACGC